MLHNLFTTSIAAICLAAVLAGGGGQSETDVAPEPVPLAQDAADTAAAEALAKMVWGEARDCTLTEQAACVWCVLNRVDSTSPCYPDTIIGVVTQPKQFHGFRPENPVDPEILALVEDVLARWSIEDTCVGEVGRVLPREYLFFSGDGQHNHFRTEWRGDETWDWSLWSPYEDAGEPNNEMKGR